LFKSVHRTTQLILIAWVFLQFSNQIQAQSVKIIVYKELDQRISKASDSIRVYNIWASWCRPCIMELPHFKEAQKQLQDQPVKFYFITMDVPDKIEKAKDILKQKGFEGSHFLLNESTNYWIEQMDPNWAGDIPYTVLVKRDGKKVPASYVFSSTKQLVEFVKANL